MNSSEKYSNVTACHQSVLLFYYGLDRGDYALAMEQVTPDCFWERGGVPLRGPQQIEESVRKKSATLVTRHVVSNFAVLKQDADSVTAVYCLVLHLYDNGSPPSLPVPGSAPFLLVDVTCELTRGRDNAWRIRQLDVQHTFSYAREVTSPLVPAPKQG
ncbi:nuclear transport factor 2 family protein [Paraburkholderia flagellata]|uniref:nuclear transport factor 2 family protein n=1 Tax=Paraburkholderia flagellata TaxID=2883241 RepID=UPI001F212F92|nr:nuclear transport factor 2 family protein [Paraburkholderia flagellata]